MAELGLGIFEQRLGLEYLKRIAGALEQANEATPLEGTVLQTEILESPPGWEPVITRQTSYILAAIHHEGDRVMQAIADLATAVAALQAQDTAIQAAITAEQAAVQQLLADFATAQANGLSADDVSSLQASIAAVGQTSSDLATAAASASSETSAVQAGDPQAPAPSAAPAVEAAAPTDVTTQATAAAPETAATPDAAPTTDSAPSGDTWTDPAAGVSDVADDSGSAAATPASS